MEKALYLIPSTLGDSPVRNVIPQYNIEILCSIRHFIVESRKSAVRFLINAVKNFPVDECTFFELNEHTSETEDISKILLPLEKGESMGIISDAGCPCIGDPGARAVEIAHKKGFSVIPLVGPNSMILALMASGFNGQNFSFNGYIPAKNSMRESRIKQLENRVYKENQTQIFIEAPYRNEKMIESILKSCRNETKLCIAAGITTEKQFISAKSIAEWKKTKMPELNKIPAIFMLYR